MKKKFVVEQLQALGVYLIAAPLSFLALAGVIWVLVELLE